MTSRRRPRVVHLGVALVLLATATVATATSATTSASATGAASSELPWPDRRFAPCGALDPASDTLYAFGGRADDGATHLGDLWALSLGSAGSARPEWTLLAGAGATNAPPPVRTCAAAWDPTSARLIVFGGWDGVSHAPGVRAFDPVSGAWEVMCDATSCGSGPVPRRASQVAVDDARRRLLVLGGTNGTYFDDLWSLSLDTLSWTRIEPSGAAPISRGGHSVALDQLRDALFLFGGTRPGADLGDVWRLALATDTWTQLTPSCPGGCPAARSGALLAGDGNDDRLVLYGGWESSTNTYHGETWVLEHLEDHPTWRRIEPASESPQPRFYAIGGYEPRHDRLVVFGGGSGSNAFKDAVGLTLPADGASSWHSLAPVVPLTARDQATLVLDDGVLTTFGGFGAGTLPGTVDAGTHLAETWQLALDRRARWRLATATDERSVPIAREGAASALDEAGDRLLVFGGLTGDTTLADVWSVDLASPGRPRWRQVCSPTSCGAGPSPRWAAHAAYDAANDRFVVFGGLTSAGTTNDVWALDLHGRPTWTELHPDGPLPPPRWSAAHGYDPIGRRLVVFGGQSGPDASGTPLDDTWALRLDGPPAWTRLAVDGPRPAPRRSAAAAVRVAAGRPELVVATGLTTTTGVHHDDVWSLDLGSDTAQWVELEPDGTAGGPAPRRSATAVYDAATDRLVTSFGRDAGSFFADTWAYHFATGEWHQLRT